ncbi:MAG: fibronectin type III domain-containing protein [Muribaculaceae bacterium]|nr:fibronectin type III domain-containing protein [Muribaculaceae bacterium]
MKVNRILPIVALGAAFVVAATTPMRYGTGLKGTGSDEPAHTIFTNPGEDCSTSMSVSWATPVGKESKLVLINKASGDTTTILSKGVICTTFDSINSKLGDNSDVYERHIFDHHVVRLNDLTPDTRYEYYIQSDEPTGVVKSEPHYFITAGVPAWKAAVIGDFHHYSPLWGRLDHSMAMINVIDSVAGGVDWVLSTGDQCAWGGSYNYWTELACQPAYKNMMWGGVQGNHDHMTRDNAKSDLFFKDTHGNPLNGYKDQEGISYWFKYGDVLFIMLNNEAMRTKASLEPVFEWMEKVVTENPSRYIVVVEHYEWLIGTNGTNSQLDRFRDIFDRLGVDLAISGNNHAYLRTPALKDRQPVAAGQGTFYVVASSSDNGRGRSLKPIEANNEIISTRWSEGPHTVGAMLMDVDSTRIVMSLYDRNGSVRDTFTVPAKSAR